MSSFFKALRNNWGRWIIASVLVVFFGYLAASEFDRWYSLQREIDEREDEIVAAEEETQQLQARLERVSDPAFLEKEARRKLNVKGENEEVFVVVGLESISPPEDFSDVFERPHNKKENDIFSNAKEWWRYFFR